MVLEQILDLKSVERRSLNVFLLGVIYAFLGILCARVIFPESMGLMSVAFTSILLIPSLSFMLQAEENVEIREKKMSLVLLFRDHKDIFRIYLLLFLGIFLAYSLTALLWPSSAILHYFDAQAKTAGLSGLAMDPYSFSGVVTNNLLVLFVCFLLSLIYGSGAVLFLTWNASVWGIVFGFFAHYAAVASNQSLFVAFSVSVLPFMPHMVAEALSYISAAVVGGVVSKAVLRERLFSKKFHHILTDAMMLLAIAILLVIIAGVIEVNISF